MGQYYLPLLVKGNSKKVFDSHIIMNDGSIEFNGLKLMEHSWSGNIVCGAVVRALFHKKARVCWMGDYANEENYAQVNCDDVELKTKLYNIVWKDDRAEYLQTAKQCDRLLLNGLIIVNHTKKVYIKCDEYLKHNTDEYGYCVHPLPILTCSASHSGGAYYGPNSNLCGSWFYDEIEVIKAREESRDYEEILPVFLDR